MWQKYIIWTSIYLNNWRGLFNYFCTFWEKGIWKIVARADTYYSSFLKHNWKSGANTPLYYILVIGVITTSVILNIDLGGHFAILIRLDSFLKYYTLIYINPSNNDHLKYVKHLYFNWYKNRICIHFSEMGQQFEYITINLFGFLYFEIYCVFKLKFAKLFFIWMKSLWYQVQIKEDFHCLNFTLMLEKVIIS